MSWWGTSKTKEADLIKEREERRQKLEAERLQRLQQRSQRQILWESKLKSAEKSRQEVEQVLAEFNAIADDIFSGCDGDIDI